MAPGKTNRRARASQASAWELKRSGASQGNPGDLFDTSALNEGEKKHRLCCAWDFAFLHIPWQIAGMCMKMKSPFAWVDARAGFFPSNPSTAVPSFY